MPLAIPPELKAIIAYIRRAEELDANKSDPSHQQVAYYCRSHAMARAMQLGVRGDDVEPFLMSLMQQLEDTKSAVSLSQDEGKALCEGFAMRVFHAADDEDRADGSAGDKNYREIARSFYNSSTFFEILEQFGELDPEIKSKLTYSKWKAREIMKAVKEGRTPTPGGYGGDEAPDTSSNHSDDQTAAGRMQDLSMGSTTPTLDLPPTPVGMDRDLAPTLPSVPGNFQMPMQPQYGQQPQFGQQQNSPQHHSPQHQLSQHQQFPQHPPQQHYQHPHVPPQQHMPPHQPAQVAAPPQQPSSHQPSPHYVPPPKTNNLQGNIADALELCSFAMAALKHNDTKLGRDRLRDALQLLS
jgi:vacuolar protein sorting-associated protein VTA1